MDVTKKFLLVILCVIQISGIIYGIATSWNSRLSKPSQCFFYIYLCHTVSILICHLVITNSFIVRLAQLMKFSWKSNINSDLSYVSKIILPNHYLKSLMDNKSSCDVYFIKLNYLSRNNIDLLLIYSFCQVNSPEINRPLLSCFMPSGEMWQWRRTLHFDQSLYTNMPVGAELLKSLILKVSFKVTCNQQK